ncbi:TonB-dependent receptor [Nibricoccus aquaticus]|nr:TonB-dependent receptor [Nibricoccus aquaticus]
MSPFQVRDTTVVGFSLAVSHTELPLGSLANTTTLSDAFAGFHIATSGAHSFNDTIALRGLSNTPIFGTPAVAVYLDAIPLLGASTLPGELAGLSGAALHRGPAESAHFGYAGPAGVLQLYSPAVFLASDDSTLHANSSISATVGDYSLRAGSVSTAFSTHGKTSVFASASGQSRDGYIFNRTLGHDVDHRDNRSGLLRLETHPFTPLTLALTFHATRARDGEQPLVPLDGPFYEIDRASEGFTEHQALNAGLSARIDTAPGTLTATASLNHWDLGPYRSVLAFGPMELLNDATLSRRNQNLELRFISAPDSDTTSAGWSMTGFTSRAKTSGSFARAFSGFTFEESAYEITDHPLALSTDVWLRFAHRWKLAAGLRAERNDQTFVRREQIPTVQTYTLNATDTAFLPRVQLTHDLSAHTAWSLAAAAGRKPGGYSAFTGNRILAAFAPERTRSLETSLSRTFPRQHLRTTIRAYAYAISGYQIERSFATGAFTDDYLVVNAPHARSLGSEWETAWQPTASLTLRAAAGLTRVTLREFTDPYSKIRYDGRRAPFSPSHDATLSATCRLPAGFEGTLAVNSTGRIDYTESEDPRYAQRTFTVINASLAYRARFWRAGLAVRNLTGREYYSSITPGTGHGTPGAPQTIALTFELFTPAK